jgi:hypothetical protein
VELYLQSSIRPRGLALNETGNALPIPLIGFMNKPMLETTILYEERPIFLTLPSVLI